MAANESAPSTAQSKRERKRQFINERLAFLDEKFRQDRDFTYRDQLQKIQVDTTLIQRLDPYDPNVLDTIADLRREHAEAQVSDTLPESVRSLIQMAGPDFQVFLQEIEDVVENRDANVTQQKVRLVCPVPREGKKKLLY
jgi:Sds3-like protein